MTSHAKTYPNGFLLNRLSDWLLIGGVHESVERPLLFYLLNHCSALLFSCCFNVLVVHVQCSILQLVCRNERSDNAEFQQDTIPAKSLSAK